MAVTAAAAPKWDAVRAPAMPAELEFVRACTSQVAHVYFEAEHAGVVKHAMARACHAPYAFETAMLATCGRTHPGAGKS